MSARETDADQNVNDVDAPIAGTFGGEATGARTLGERFADDDTDTPDTPGDDAVASGADPDSTSSS